LQEENMPSQFLTKPIASSIVQKHTVDTFDTFDT
jgi:hypothetical protein